MVTITAEDEAKMWFDDVCWHKIVYARARGVPMSLTAAAVVKPPPLQDAARTKAIRAARAAIVEALRKQVHPDPPAKVAARRKRAEAAASTVTGWDYDGRLTSR